MSMWEKGLQWILDTPINCNIGISIGKLNGAINDTGPYGHLQDDSERESVCVRMFNASIITCIHVKIVRSGLLELKMIELEIEPGLRQSFPKTFVSLLLRRSPEPDSLEQLSV